MGCTKAKRRRQEKISTVAGVVPTVPTVADHCTNGWLATDIYKGEIFINTADNKAYTRGNAGIFEITSSASGVQTVTGNIVDNTDPANPVIESRVLEVNTTTAGTPANTDPTTLASFTLPANTLSANDDFIDIQVSFTGDAGTEVIASVYVNGLGGDLLAETNYSGSGYGVIWLTFQIRLIRKTSNSAISSLLCSFDTQVPYLGALGHFSSFAMDFTVDNDITVIGQNVVGNANALVFESMTITKN